MNRLFGIAIFLLFLSCQKNLKHEKYVQNLSADTVFVINPDFDSVYTIYPGRSAMIYSFEILDTKQEKEDCKWLGDTLWIYNHLDSVCKKLPTIEENWELVVEGPEKERVQKCTFMVDNDDF